MIQIQITSNDHVEKLIKVSGHANYAPHGQDIVCASVSTLLQVTGYTLEGLGLSVTLNFEDSGFGSIAIHDTYYESSGYGAIKVFETGAKLLAEQYPKHVILEMG